MQRRRFLSGVVAGGVLASLPLQRVQAEENPERRGAASPPPDAPKLPTRIAGMSLAELRDDCRRRLFDEYLPFWEKGALDRKYGGIMCELNSDGSVADGAKTAWYQGRGLWVYSFLYNHFGRDEKWLRTAELLRRFAIEHMYAGGGRWREKTQRDGQVIEDVSPVVFGGLFMAEGLIEHYRATGDVRDAKLATETVRRALREYESPDYNNTYSTYTLAKVPPRGLRSLGHSMIFLRVLEQWPDELLAADLATARDEHLDALVNRFWNPRYGIANEFLKRDYTRFPEYEGCMYAGHTIESAWMIMAEALRRKDRALWDKAKDRFCRLVAMSWDYIFGGCCSEDYLAVAVEGRCPGPWLDIKTMWAQCEVMVGCMLALECTGETWAREWYERTREFTLRVMPCEAAGVWRQAVDRVGNNHVRKEAGISDKRRDNYHQARFLMLNLLSLERMLKNHGAVTPFPV